MYSSFFLSHLPRALNALIAMLFLFLGSWSNHAFALDECDELAQQNAHWQADLESFSATEKIFSDFFKGRVPSDTLPISRVLAPIGVERSLKDTLAILLSQRKQLLNELQNPPANMLAAECGELVTLWTSIRQRYWNAQIANIDSKLSMLKLDPVNLRLLFRELKAWQQVQHVMEDVESSLDGLDPAEAVNFDTHLQALIGWGRDYRLVLEAWLPLLLTEKTDVNTVTPVWQQSLAVKRVDAATNWTQLELKFSDLSLGWHDALLDTRSELVLGLSQWRNDAIWSAGWTYFFRSLASPAIFSDLLINEVLAAPGNLWDSLSAFFLREYRYYQRQNAVASLIFSWTLQGFGLILSLFLVVKLAESVPALVARAQQSSLDHLEGASSRRFVSGIYWFIKPNLPWLAVLISTQWVAAYAKPQSILSWIGPIGALYALFRLTRVVFEWLLSRTYSRAGEFVSPNVAKTIILDCHRFAWAIIVCAIVWWLGIGTGGGYLRYLLSLSTALLAWWALQWLLFRHRDAASRFIPLSSNRKQGKKQSEPVSFFSRMINKSSTPLLFLASHLIDGVRSLNEKLLSFDSYRSFSVKLLRARLESKVEEETDDEAEPDENYTDWMLRVAKPEMVFDVGEPERVLEPIQLWYKDKTEENVIVLVGESGSGKTTFVEQLPAKWSETEIRFIRYTTKTCDPAVVLNSVAEALHQKSIADVSELVKLDVELEPQVIVIDDAQNLFLAEVGQFDAYKTLMQCMNAQLNNIFWVVAMHAPSWSYLSCVFAREQRVSTVYRMPRWSPQEIRRLILSRHQGGKRRLRYNELLLSAAASSESSSVRGADSRVFNILWEQSGGNPIEAIELWLNAAKVKGRIVEIGLPQRPSAAPLSNMKTDLYFVFAAIVVHGELSTKEIMLVTHFAEPIVRHALKQGINLGLIDRDEDGRYTIDSYWYGTLSAFLQRKNLLWV